MDVTTRGDRPAGPSPRRFTGDHAVSKEAVRKAAGLFLLLSLLAAGLSPAAARATGDSLDRAEGSARALESWYLAIAPGFSHTAYPSPLREALYGRASGGSRFQFGGDALGAYLPLPDRHTIVGLVLNVAADLYNDGDGFMLDSNEVVIDQLTFGASALHFLAGEVGDGPFVRFDAGVAVLSITEFSPPVIRRTGVGLLVGTGYALPISDDDRILLSVTYAGRRAGGDNYGTLGITLGMLL